LVCVRCTLFVVNVPFGFSSLWVKLKQPFLILAYIYQSRTFSSELWNRGVVLPQYLVKFVFALGRWNKVWRASESQAMFATHKRVTTIVLEHIFSANALFTPKVATFTPSENHTKVMVQFLKIVMRGKSIKFHIRFSPNLSHCRSQELLQNLYCRWFKCIFYMVATWKKSGTLSPPSHLSIRLL
jgi:hypothetical protein